MQFALCCIVDLLVMIIFMMISPTSAVPASRQYLYTKFLAMNMMSELSITLNLTRVIALH